LLLGQYWLAQDDAVRAERELAFAQTLDPKNPAIMAAYGSALARSGKLTKAAEAFRAAAERNPQDPAFWKLLAEFSLQHEFEVTTVGIPAARNAAALSPEDASAVAALGYATHLAGESLLGERLVQRSLSLDPRLALTWYRYGLLLLDGARYDEARSAMSTAAALDPEGSIGRLSKLSMERMGAKPTLARPGPD
jgi:predicted Zn-dependent protease